MSGEISPESHREKFSRPMSLSITVAGGLAIVYFLKPILLPVSLAILLSCLLLPAVSFIRKQLRISQFISALLVVVLLGLSGGYLGVLVVDHLADFSLNAPIDLSRLSSRISHNLTDVLRDYPKLDRLLPEPALVASFIERNAVLIFQGLGDPATNISRFVSQGILTLVLAIFFTVEQPILEPRLALALSQNSKDREFYEKLFRHLSRKMRHYLIVRALINALFGLTVTLVLSIFGYQHAGILGLFTGLANFVPYLGQAVAGALLAMLALAQSGSLADSLILTLTFIALCIAEGYLVTPIVMGRTMDLNATTVLLSCLFWGFLWGVVGLFLATPIAAILRLVLDQFDGGKKWASLMSMIPEATEIPDAS
jgi:predicted PurR-regulated permease PerM